MVTVVDVMNSKSKYHNRHPIPCKEMNKISKYYAMESRWFLAQPFVDGDHIRYQKTQQWLTNVMVFDFDFDPKHFPHVEDLDLALKNSMKHLEDLLGKPRWIIKNKNQYTQTQVERYFTKRGKDGNDVVALPKVHGCQVVYTLKDTLFSHHLERVRLYQKLRMKITRMVNADENFRGHMFKNYNNHSLFDIQENENENSLDLKVLSSKFLYDEPVEKIFDLRPYETLIRTMPKFFMRNNVHLVNQYNRLNQWRIHGEEPQAHFQKSASRNETLFQYCRSLTIPDLYNLSLSMVISSHIWDECDIKEPLEEEEFESVKKSVLLHREAYGDDPIKWGKNQKDLRVFKWNQEPLQWDDETGSVFYHQHEEYLKCSWEWSQKIHGEPLCVSWLDKSISMDLCVGTDERYKIVNMFIHFGPEKILSNVANLITPEMVTLLNADHRLPLDIIKDIESAVQLLHFKYYRAIQQARHAKKNVQKKPNKHQSRIKELRIQWGVNGNEESDGRFQPFYERLQKEGMLKPDGSPMPISFYQKHFHVKNTLATIYVRKIKNYLLWKRQNEQKSICQRQMDLIRQLYMNQSKNPLCDFTSQKGKQLKDIFNILKMMNNTFYYRGCYNNNCINNIYYGSYIVHLFNHADGLYRLYLMKIMKRLLKYSLSLHKSENKIKNQCYGNGKYDDPCKGFDALDFGSNKKSFYDDHMEDQMLTNDQYKNDLNIMYKRGKRMIKSILSYDVETTGLRPNSSFILSIGAVLSRWKLCNGEMVEEKTEFYQVLNWKLMIKNFSIPEATIKVHGITEDVMEREGIHPVQAFIQLYDFILQNAEDDQNPLDVINAFNLPFDLSMMRANLYYILRCNMDLSPHEKEMVESLLSLFTKSINNPTLFIDSYTIDRILHFEVDGVKVSHSLQKTGERYGMPVDENAHNAIYDTYRLLELFKMQLKELESLEIPINQRLEDRLIKKYEKGRKYTDGYLALGIGA